MKKQIMLLIVAISIGFGSSFAQEQKRLTPEERTKVAMEKIADLKLDAGATEKTQTVITDFYNAQQKAMEEMRASGNMDREAMKAKRQELATARDEKLKAIFNADQFKKWQDEIEPSLRPQRGPRQN